MTTMILKKPQLLLFVMMLLPLSAMADASGECGDHLTWTYATDTKTLSIEGSGAMTNYSDFSIAPWDSYRSEIEKVVVGADATSIGDYAFHNMPHVTDVYIHGTVTSIGDYAFQDCSGLISIVIPNSVKSIGLYAFNRCLALSSVIIGNGVTSVSAVAFYNCSGLASIKVEPGNAKYDSRNNCNAIIETASNTLIVGCKNSTIPDGVMSIGKYAFYGCIGLTSVTIPDSATSIGDMAFFGCSGLSSITLGNSVTSIGNYAFQDCSALSSVIIPNSATSIGRWAFNNCSGLSSISIPNSVKSISNGAFAGCSGLNFVTIPYSVTGIGDFAFAGCSGLSSISIPNSVKSIGEGAFSDCSGLTSIVIGSSVTSIGDEAFCSHDVSRLQHIYCYAERLPTTSTNAFSYSANINATLHVPASLLNVYQAYYPWKAFGSIVALTDEDPQPTGVEVVRGSWSKDDDYYDLNGHKLTGEPTQKGIYIHHGKKMIKN